MITKRCCLLMGSEDYLKDKFIEKIKASVLDNPNDIMNYTEINSKDIKAQQIIDLAETLPFMSNKKIIYVRDSGFMKSGNKEEAEKLEKWILNIPEYCLILFNEKEVDKRNRLYKIVNKEYQVLEFNYPEETEVYDILCEKMQENAIKIDRTVLLYFIQNMPSNLSYILSEFEKVMAYGSGNKVTKEDIDKICVFGLEQRIFELVKQVSLKNTRDVLKIYHKLVESKESPLAILVLIARQYRIIMQIKYMLKNKESLKQIASTLKLPYFAIKDMQEQALSMTFKNLQDILEECLRCDKEIKSGKIDAIRGVELLIIKCIDI